MLVLSVLRTDLTSANRKKQSFAQHSSDKTDVSQVLNASRVAITGTTAEQPH